MALADYQPERVDIPFKGGSFQVKGLSLDDVSVLMKHHLTDMDELLELYSRNVSQDIAVAATAQYAVTLVREAPALVANVLALAAEEPDSVDNARRLPIPTQIEALKVIGRLTFEEAGGAKKFFESLKDLAMRVRPPLAMTDSPT
jgi:hypothetical protein